MKCEAIQTKILTLPDPRHVPAALLAHVAECPGCRAWAEQAGRLESLLEQLPVPPAPADKKNALINQLIHGTGPLAVPAREGFAVFLKRNAALVGGLAAALLIAVGWLAFSGGNPQVAVVPPGTPRDPFLDKIVQRDVALAKADTPAKKLQALGGLAEDLSAQTRSLARVASREELGELARLYDRTVKLGMLAQAEKIAPAAMTPAEVKAEFDALTKKLNATETETKKAFDEASPEAKPALKRIVDTAVEGQKTLAAIASKKGV